MRYINIYEMTNTTIFGDYFSTTVKKKKKFENRIFSRLLHWNANKTTAIVTHARAFDCVTATVCEEAREFRRV